MGGNGIKGAGGGLRKSMLTAVSGTGGEKSKGGKRKVAEWEGE